MKRIVLICCILGVLPARSATLSQGEAMERATRWMAGNPVMQTVAARDIFSVEAFPDTGGYSVYVVQFSPAGYLVLNSDDHLPLVVSFSAESTVDLSETEQNAFRAMLLQHVAIMEEQLAQPYPTPMGAADEEVAEEATELHGPFLETTWNQCNPYNLLCPDNPGGSAYYDYRVPVGCTPTAYAQILYYHRWPYAGQGSLTYTDSSGSITGPHSADFSNPYVWSAMLTEYSAWNPNGQTAEDAVAELMYELGIAAEANYEGAGTSSSIQTLGGRLGEFFYYESCERHDDQASLIPPLESDLRAGFPCVVAIPGHAIVADGMMIDSGTTTYHINYGWGGSNNGWWSADNVAGAALDYGVTSLRPRLMVFPVTNTLEAVEGRTVEMEWLLPKRRTNEVAQLEILRLEQQTGSWQSDGAEITGENIGWEVISAGHSGDCWFTGPNDYSSHLLSEIFVPDASAELTFWQCARLYISQFSVEVSTDGGDTFDTLYITSDNIHQNYWTYQAVSLGDYAGQQILLRFVLSESGGYYNSDWAGIRVDDLAITSGDWYAWEPFAVDSTLAVRDPGEVAPEFEGQPVHYTLLNDLPIGTHTLAARLTDTGAAEHGLSPAFALTVAGTSDDGDDMPADWEETYGLDVAVNDADLDPDFDGYSNLEEYICGTVPTNAASCWMLESGNGSLPEFFGAEDRLYTILYRTNLTSGSWLPLATNIPGSNQIVTVDSYDSATNAARYYRVEVRLAD